jgi:hypothetical protein
LYSTSTPGKASLNRAAFLSVDASAWVPRSPNDTHRSPSRTRTGAAPNRAGRSSVQLFAVFRYAYPGSVLGTSVLSIVRQLPLASS